MFKLHTVASAKTEVLIKLPVTSGETITLGEALVLASGKLTAVGATATPDYIALSANKNGYATVKRIYEDEVYETTLSAAGTSLNIGDKVTINTGALNVTATTASGVFYITEILSTSIGGAVRGMFRR